MKRTLQPTKSLKALASVVCISALPLLTVSVITTGCAGDRYHESTGESIDDSATTMRVKKALSEDAQFKYNDVNVTTFKGTVQLSGFTDSRDAKRHATDIVKNLEGVKMLKNNISVK